MKIHFFNECDKDVKEYKNLIRYVLKGYSPNKEFNIIFVDDDYIQNLNKNYRNIDRVTDVISFALCDDPDNQLDTELGDVFIDLDQAFRQAGEYGHSIEREVAFLAVHGYLHLCGYDHMSKEDEMLMFKKQDEILDKANIKR